MMRRHLAIFVLVASVLVSLAPVRSAQAEITVKLATLAPEGTVWYRAVRNIADRWGEISEGEVKVKIYPGGVVGNETVIVRKMRIGQLHAGAVTSVGLADIDSSAMVTQSPMLIHDYDELDYVMQKMGAKFEELLAEKGFVVLNWSDAGWMHIFTKGKMLQPEDASKFKLFAFEGEPATIDAYKASGMRPVVLAATDVLPSLQSGLISGFPTTPLAALSQQWFALAPNMLDLRWAPLLAATIIRKDVWESIPEKYRADFMKAARQAGTESAREVRRQDRKAIEVMKKYGLQVHALPDGARERWQTASAKSWPTIREKIVGDAIFSETQGHLQEYRSSK
jgi:TRAP-type C4-dicarboxylate transport system substrate-binding protein